MISDGIQILHMCVYVMFQGIGSHLVDGSFNLQLLHFFYGHELVGRLSTESTAYVYIYICFSTACKFNNLFQFDTVPFMLRGQNKIILTCLVCKECFQNPTHPTKIHQRISAHEMNVYISRQHSGLVWRRGYPPPI